MYDIAIVGGGIIGLSAAYELVNKYPEKKNKHYQKASLISEINDSQKIPYCPITLGTNFLDQVSFL